MIKSEIDIYNKAFSHIYIEKQALNHPNTQNILKHFNNSKIIKINHYKDIFCRPHQNFYIQKKAPSLILALKKDNLIYKGAKFCDDFGNDYFYYTSSMMNCIYNCEYCYLQGMYPSSNIVIFVNIEDIFNEIEKLLIMHPAYVCISYDTDILAFENILGYGAKWINFCQKHDNLKIELRTKSANFNSIKHIAPCENIILAWTLSPDIISEKFEDKTPSLDARLESIQNAIHNGWKVRICFDPILYLKNYKENYNKLITKVFSTISKDKIYDVSIGVFRVSSDYLKIMRKVRPKSPIINYPFITKDRVCTYDNILSKEMVNYVYSLTKKYIPKEKIYI